MRQGWNRCNFSLTGLTNQVKVPLSPPPPCGVRGMTRLFLICSPIFLLSLCMAHWVPLPAVVILRWECWVQSRSCSLLSCSAWAETKSTHNATRMMHRRSMILMDGHLNRPLMPIHRQRMVCSGNLARSQLCGKGRHPHGAAAAARGWLGHEPPSSLKTTAPGLVPFPLYHTCPPLSIVANSTGCKLSLWAGWLYCGARWWARAQAPSAWPWLTRYTPVFPLPGAHGSHAAWCRMLLLKPGSPFPSRLSIVVL